MLESSYAEANRILRQAKELLSRVKRDIATRSFESDDVRMETYNSLLSAACEIFPEDDILNEQMATMPDATLLSLSWQYLFNHPDVASGRLEEHLSALINRLEILVEEELEEIEEPEEELVDEQVQKTKKSSLYEEGSLLHFMALS